ncbi:glycoside hydrolase family 3 C-terminal domain-containing protein [Gemmiger formicilis]|nr:glycoside hydrolase family 3 C-terminal domain-containing protein [Gemmiger formicilis]
MTEVLKQAKQKGMKTVVLLNISDRRDGGLAALRGCSALHLHSRLHGRRGSDTSADGQAEPGGRLPVTFPIRYEDTPAYPNFPGEGNDAYYGEGVFVGYRSYAKRKLAVQYPFGCGLSYTDFSVELCENDFRWDMRTQETLHVPVRVKTSAAAPAARSYSFIPARKSPICCAPTAHWWDMPRCALPR